LGCVAVARDARRVGGSISLSLDTVPAGAPRWTEIDWEPHVHDTTVLGRRLRYVDYGDGPPLLLIHGLGGCWQWWLENIPDLGRDHRVIAVDLHGFGASEELPPRVEMSTHADAMAALLDELEIEQAVLCAHSMGGLIALRFAVTCRARLSGLVLVCAGGILLNPRRLALLNIGFRAFHALFARPGVPRAFSRRPRLRSLLFSEALGDLSTLRPELAAQIVPCLAAPGFNEAVRAGIRVANELSAKDVDAPTLMIWGDGDPILPVAQARELAERLPNARLEVFEGVGHCPMLERPAEFNSLIRDFVARLVSTH
jgi:pimeloyl-ACP methyl ester carboxylesterase